MANKFCFATICVLALASYSSARTHRRKNSRDSCDSYNQFMNKSSGLCQDCKTCPAGSGVHQLCNSLSEYSDTVCEPCLEGSTYSTGRSHFGAPCYPCTRCGGRAILKACSPTSDTVCGDCPIGTYWDATWGQCRKCSFCFGNARSRTTYMTSACMKMEIPSTHWCVHLNSPPYHAPKLYSQVLSNGTTIFFTDSDPVPSEVPTPEVDKDVIAYEEFLQYTSLTDPGAKEDENEIADPSADQDEPETGDQGWLNGVVEDINIKEIAQPSNPPSEETHLSAEELMPYKIFFLLSMAILLLCAIIATTACVITRCKQHRFATVHYEPLSKHYDVRQLPRSNRQDVKSVPAW